MATKPKATANARAEVKLGARTLRADTNALCDFEDIAGKNISALGENPGFRDIRAMVQAFGRYETADEAGKAIDAVGFNAASEAVSAALEAAFGTPDDAGEA